ncbi:hypothetical protein TRFO_35440 [Tritrichomonas foetus]|uniref:Uncharacterized protein n=1 Tax=Tritrichomonas foetus TaxID=1144522 RepID=A0A1J4JG91_9EUKA|nr:hypothetical protein TRFO_35440 [Tritrichomonas foetus]|eukprot:OHS98206.1 hypothetical protein TRFO_35440 [Tritrichomonas foetus]
MYVKGQMEVEKIFNPRTIECHSRNRPPDVEVAEFKARQVWEDWDDFPPYQKSDFPQKFQSNLTSLNDNLTKYKPQSDNYIEITKQLYNNEVKKTREEIEEMRKHFKFGDETQDIDYRARKYGGDNSFEYFNQNQSRPTKSAIQSFYQIKNFNGSQSSAEKYPNINDSINNSIMNQKNPYTNINYTGDIRDNNYSHYNFSENDPFMNNSFEKGRFGFDSKSSNYKPPEKKSEEYDYDITAAATLEAQLLRKQNEEIRKRLQFLTAKLESTKKENFELLSQIEKSEIERHKMKAQLHS